MLQFLSNQKKRLHDMNQEGLLQCRICEDEISPDVSIACKRGHTFCRDCVKNACENALGEGRSVVKCLEKCEESFDLRSLSLFVSRKIISPIAQTEQCEAVKMVRKSNLKRFNLHSLYIITCVYFRL